MMNATHAMILDGSITAQNDPIQPEGPTPMNAPNPFTSLDEQINKIRRDYESRIKEREDRLLATQIELTMTKSALAERTKERDQSERIALKFVTQFDVVAKIFAEVQALALSHETINGKPADQPQSGPATTRHASDQPQSGSATPSIMIDGVQAPEPTHDASWQNPETGKWYDAVTLNGNIMSWQERPPSQIEFEPSDATKTLISGQRG